MRRPPRRSPAVLHPLPSPLLQAEILQEEVGYNEVTSKQVPEWQKIMWRYLDWVCIVIVRAAPAAPATPATRSTCALFASDAARQRGANVAAPSSQLAVTSSPGADGGCHHLGGGPQQRLPRVDLLCAAAHRAQFGGVGGVVDRPERW